MMQKNSKNLHACAIAIGGKGILITGPSGSGKTSLAFGLMERCQRENLEAAFIADDQVLVRRNGNSLVVETPPAIAGKAELHGFGIVEVQHQSSAIIHLVVRLVDAELIERYPEPSFEEIEQVPIPRIEVPRQHEENAARIVMAAINRMIAGQAHHN